MKIFKNYTFTWWQMAIFKICLLSIGVAIGAYFSDVFLPFSLALVALGIALGIYIGFVGFKK